MIFDTPVQELDLCCIKSDSCECTHDDRESPQIQWQEVRWGCGVRTDHGRLKSFPRNYYLFQETDNAVISFTKMKPQSYRFVEYSSWRPVDIPTWFERKRTAAVTSSCLQREEVLVGISLFWTFFFPRGHWTNKNYHSHPDWTVQYGHTRVQHIVLISRHVRANENSMAAWKLRLQSRSVWASGMLGAVCPRGERMLTHSVFFKSQIPENWEDGTQRYCTVFPENIMIAIESPCS